MKKWSEMNNEEKLDTLLEQCSRMRDQIDKLIDTMNQVTTHLNEFNGQALPYIKEKKYET